MNEFSVVHSYYLWLNCSMKDNLYLVDAFTSQQHTGNPAAVCLLDERAGQPGLDAGHGGGNEALRDGLPGA